MEEESTVGTSQAKRGWLLIAGAFAGAALTVAAALVLRALLSPPTPEASPAPRFVEEAQMAGLDHSYEGDFSFFVGGGVAVFDCDNDGRQDIYLAGGSSRAGLYRNSSVVGGPMSFQRVGDSATDLADVLGAYPIDIDADGNVDLMVLRLGENIALRGSGNCSFERANEAWSIDGGDEWTAAFSASWEPGNGLPTLAFGNYLDWPVDRSKLATCADNVLLRPDGDRYDAPMPLSPGFCTLSVMFTNWDGSGRADLRVANDRHYYISGSEQMWNIPADGQPRLYTADDGWKDLRIWGMGIASQDLTGDDLPEFFVTSQGDNKLQTLEANSTGPTYRDIAINYGVTAHRPFVGDATLPSTGWHPEFQDVNNDGFIDLFITKGNVEAMVGYSMEDPNNLLLGHPDGVFVESADVAGVASTARSRGAALADFNLDGMLDLIVVNRSENVQLWRNVGVGSDVAPEHIGNWLAVRVQLDGHNRDAIGARIKIEADGRKTYRDIAIGGGHAGDQLGWVHFGLGEAESASVTVLDANGDVLIDHAGIKANSFVVLGTEEPVVYWTLPN